LGGGPGGPVGIQKSLCETRRQKREERGNMDEGDQRLKQWAEYKPSGEKNEAAIVGRLTMERTTAKKPKILRAN